VQVDAQKYLDLVEATNKIAFFDIEAGGLRGDYNSVIVVSVKPYGLKPTSFAIKQPGNDQRVVREAKEYLETFDVYCGHYSKGFDIPMLNTRLLKWGMNPIEKRHHIDTFYALKNKILTGKALGHLAGWLELPEQKMSVGADQWVEIIRNTEKAIKGMTARCESDAAVTEELYKRIRHLIIDITK
jgi:DNA polymerase elongation subunit (family B)